MAPSVNINNFEETLWFSHIDHDCYCDYRQPRHALLWVRSGRVEVEKNGEKIVAIPGDIIFVRRDCCASMSKLSDGDTPYSSIAVTLNRDFLKDFYNRHQSKLSTKEIAFQGFASILKPTIELRSLFQSLVPYDDAHVNPSEEMLQRKLDETVMAIINADRRIIQVLFDFRESWKVDLLEFMEQNFTQDLSMEEFASYCGRSISTFKRDFAKLSDLTPQRWITGKRLDRAHQLLSERKCRPSDVYLQVGFNNRTHFIAAFKRRFGYTPSTLQQTRI